MPETGGCISSLVWLPDCLKLAWPLSMSCTKAPGGVMGRLSLRGGSEALGHAEAQLHFRSHS